MKQKTLKKSAHFISVLLNIGCMIFGIFSVSLFAGIMVIVCAPLFSPEMFQTVWENAVSEGQTLSFGQCVFFFICCLGKFICIFLSLYHAKRIFGCIGKGNSPFTPKTAVQIRKIVWYVLLFAVFSKCHFPQSLCAVCLPLSCFVFPSYLIMGASYSRK